ncbi:MAG: hypothetical protein LBN97_07720 [Oscillospiraceae bacterium]|nr:hypothetical protein [Oscillospiraceae bacterium]
MENSYKKLESVYEIEELLGYSFYATGKMRPNVIEKIDSVVKVLKHINNPDKYPEPSVEENETTYALLHDLREYYNNEAEDMRLEREFRQQRTEQSIYNIFMKMNQPDAEFNKMTANWGVDITKLMILNSLSDYDFTDILMGSESIAFGSVESGIHENENGDNPNAKIIDSFHPLFVRQIHFKYDPKHSDDVNFGWFRNMRSDVHVFLIGCSYEYLIDDEHLGCCVLQIANYRNRGLAYDLCVL